MKITFIQHSKTVFDKFTPIPLWQLSSEGIALVEELSKNENIKDIDILYSSLQTKALQTAITLAKDNHIPIKTHEQLTELSSITKQILPNYEESVKELYSGKVERLNGGESIIECRDRINKTIEKIVSKEKNVENIGIITHCNVASIFASQYSDYDAYTIHSMIKMPDIAVFDWNEKKFIKFFGEQK